ncbi:MAG: tRNA lysidine(34) synthetase TilS [Planctomycetota bacterium]
MSDPTGAVERRVAEAIREHDLLPKGADVLLGLSGGRDSVCLAGVLQALSAWGGWRIEAVHFDHGLRGEAAAADEAHFCQALCAQLSLPLRLERLAVTPRPGESLETAARTARLHGFRRLAQATGVRHVATAHQADDRVETLLFRMLRGTGLRGLTGIDWRRCEGLAMAALPAGGAAAGGSAIGAEGGGLGARTASLTFHRPLLSIWREETTAYCRARGLTWVDDPSNASDAHTRNRIRHELLPRLDEFNAKARQHLWEVAEDAGQWEEAAQEAGAEHDFPFGALPWTLDGATLLALGRGRAVAALQRTLEIARRQETREPVAELAEPVEAAVADVGGSGVSGKAGRGALSRRHFDLLWALLTDPAAPAAVDLPGGWTVRRVGTPPHARIQIDRVERSTGGNGRG